MKNEFYPLLEGEDAIVCRKCNIVIIYEKGKEITEKIPFKDSEDYAMNFYIECPKCHEKIKTGGFVTRYG